MTGGTYDFVMWQKAPVASRVEPRTRFWKRKEQRRGINKGAPQLTSGSNKMKRCIWTLFLLRLTLLSASIIHLACLCCHLMTLLFHASAASFPLSRCSDQKQPHGVADTQGAVLMMKCDAEARFSKKRCARNACCLQIPKLQLQCFSKQATGLDVVWERIRRQKFIITLPYLFSHYVQAAE